MNLYAGTFRFDVTPPMGHSLCGGWIKPASGIDDALEAVGLVVLGGGAPVVIVAVDWCGILNGAHRQFREALADAAHTTAERVAIHAVHQHNAPFVCLESQQLTSAYADLPSVIDKDFWRRCVDRGAQAVREAIGRARPLTGVGTGQARVERVASNRRFLNVEGRVTQWRGSSTQDAALQALPEGLIDPLLKTVALYDGSRKLAALHFYATHPMSYYGDGRVSSDFAGLARKRRQQEEPETTHLYLTGCAGNVAAGKYNQGTPASRRELTDRLYAGIVASEQSLQPADIAEIEWKSTEVLPMPRGRETMGELEGMIARRDLSLPNRIRPAMELAWRRRCAAGELPIVVSALTINEAVLVHLPSECFVEYQLRLQEQHPDRFVATAAYGDGGPWYIPTRDAFPQGGYEVDYSFCEDSVDADLMNSIARVI